MSYCNLLQIGFARWPRMALLSILACLSLCLATHAGEPTAPAPGSTVTFYAMGDVPYAPEEDKLLPKQIANLPADGQFVVHVGDIKDGATPCDEAVYIKVASMLGKTKLPTFIIPGDNEWNDCTAPAQAWQYWVRHFNHFDKKWKYDFPVERQKVRSENFTFRINGVLFLGINLVGGRVHDEAEWKTRHAQNVDWAKATIDRQTQNIHAIVLFGHAHPLPVHNDFFTPFVEIIKTAKHPTLYIHGDGHRWIQDKPFGTDLITRVQVDQGGIAPPVKVTVTASPTQPFVFDRRKPETP